MRKNSGLEEGEFHALLLWENGIMHKSFGIHYSLIPRIVVKVKRESLLYL